MKDQIIVDGRYMKAFMSAYQAFSKSRDPKAAPVDLSNYLIRLSEEVGSYFIHFVPLKRVHRPMEPEHRSDAIYFVRMTDFKIIRFRVGKFGQGASSPA